MQGFQYSINAFAARTSNARSVPMQKHYGVYVVFPPRMPINIEIKTKTWIQCCVVSTLRLGSMLFIHLWFYLRILSASHPQHFFQYMLMRTKYRLLANGLFARKKIIVRFAAHLFIFIFSVLYFLFYISLYAVFYSFFSLHAVFFCSVSYCNWCVQNVWFCFASLYSKYTFI